MRLFTSALCTAVAVGLLAGCSGSNLGSTSSIPSTSGAQSHHVQAFSLIPADLRPGGALNTAHQLTFNSPDKKKKGKGGIYVSEFYGSDIYGYTNPDSNNGAPICTVSGVSYPNSIAVDGKGNLIDPDGGTRSIIVFKGPAMCGASAGSTSDTYGQPADAASANAATGTIAVGNIFDNSSVNSGHGSISLCTLKGGCTTNLTASSMYEVAGVAQAKNGDCWASATDSAGTATLTYFKGCSGSGTQATGFKNSSYGGLDIDSKGNIVSIDSFANGTGAVYVYKGCNPACTVVGGPFALSGESVFGHLDKKSKNFAAGDFANGKVDVYSYSATKGLKLEYSITNGLSSSLDVEGVAFNPRSKE